MDWDIVVIILLWLWVARWILGAGYGINLMQKRIPFTWQDTFIVGPVFWVGYGVGRGIRLITNRIRG